VKPERLPGLQPRALTGAERTEVRDTLNSSEFVDESPPTVYATLLDSGIYMCSVPTMYRVLRAYGEVHERRRQATHPATVKPELVAEAPNQVWSWDITKLHGPVKWNYFYLYVVIDIFSRYVTAWMLARAENAHLAKVLIKEAVARQGIEKGQLSLHMDRGSPMRAKPFAFLLADLGVTKSFSRP
jgi:transposase InsO family protein